MNSAVIPAIQALSTTAFDGSTKSAVEYAAALTGLDAAQQKVAMSMMGIDAAGQKQILNMISLIEASKTLTIEEFERAAGMAAGTISTKLNISATEMMTEATLHSAIAQGVLGDAQLEAFSKTTAHTGAMAAQGVAATALSGKLKILAASAKAAGAAMLTNPVGWILILGSLIPLIIRGIKKLSAAEEEAYEQAEALRSKYEESKRELEGMEEELKNNGKRLAELQELSAKGTITLIEKEELERLQRTNAELATTIARKRELAEIEAEDADKALRKAFDKGLGKRQVAPYQEVFGGELDRVGAKYGTHQEIVESTSISPAVRARYHELADMLSTSDNPRSKMEEFDRLVSFDEYIEILVELYNETLRDIEESTDEGIRELKSATLDYIRGKLVSSAEEIGSDYMDKYFSEDDFKDRLQGLLDVINKTVYPAEYFNEKLSELPEDILGGLKEVGKSSALTSEDISKLTFQFPQLKAWMDECGYSAEDVAANFNALSRAQEAAGTAAAGSGAGVKDLAETLSELRNSYDLLDKARAEMRSDGGLSAETIAALAKQEEDYLKYLYEENGVVKLNAEAWKERADAAAREEVDKIKQEIGALYEQNDALYEQIAAKKALLKEDIDSGAYTGILKEIGELNQAIDENNRAISKNQSMLAVYGAVYGSITGDLDAYKNALANFSNTKSVIDEVSSSFKTLADIQSQVANGFTISLEKALEFASVYPEILNNATATADGQIALNESVANTFLEAKKKELDAKIDAQISELEAEKAVLEAKKASAEAQLRLAENVGEGEGQISKEVAEYRLNTANALTQALIDIGVEEADAHALVTAAMGENEEEFARIAKECFENMDDNAAKAAYNMAQNIFNNAQDSAKSIADIAKQAHETAEAIDAMGRGVRAGSSTPVKVRGGGRQRGGVALDLYEGEFKESDAQYEATTISLDDYVSQLKLDISSYTSAIEQINGQIEALRALKNVPLEKFSSSSGTGSGSGSGGTGSDIKEVEEYVATLEDYREALERLAKARQTVAEIQRKIDDSDNLKEQLILERELIDAYEREQAALHHLNNQRDSTITAGAKALRKLGFEVSYNADTNELWIANMEHLNELTADSAGEYETLQEATNELRKETEELIESLTELNEANKDGSEEWWELRSSIIDAREQIQKLLQDIVKEASQAVDAMQNVYDTLHSAADEYAETGYVTVDTLQKIIDLGVEYVAYLRDEDGQLVINEERIRAVVAAKTEQLAIESSMSYITALRIAQEEGDIETLNRLLYATEQATDATWGLVYANLQMLGLSDSQYNAALDNINAIRAIAENAIDGIGKVGSSVKDELSGMKDGLDDILKYVMDMLKQRIDDQIDSLEDMKDAYSEIINMKKASLKASKEEADYQKSLASKMREIARLQAKIDMLSLAADQGDRKAAAERAALQEEMAKLQEDLADEQAEHAIDAHEDALDRMEKAYHDEKDKEIMILEDSISSYQKLYDMAIDYIENHWDTLYNELISWNTQYGSVLNSEITSAWDNALAAAQKYGSYVSALNNIDADISASSSSGTNLKVGNTYYSDKADNADMARAIVMRMKGYSKQWSTSNTKALNDSLHEKAVLEASRLDQYGVHAEFKSDGTWVITRDDNNPSNIGRKLYEVYHSGGIVGGGGIKDNEEFALLKNKEWVLSEEMVDNLTAQMQRLRALQASFGSMPDYISRSVLANILRSDGIGTVNNVTNNNGQPVRIEIGETKIYGADGSTVQQHVTITRNMVNEIARLLKIGM